MDSTHLLEQQGTQPLHPVGALRLLGLGAIAGLLGALGSVVFLLTIGVVQNAVFHARFGLALEAHQYLEPSPWGWGVVLVPPIAALAVTWVTRQWSAEARGSGVPEVMYALQYHGGRIRPKVAASKALASALSIGSGASVGREGPVVQIGAVLGSVLAHWAGLPTHQRVTLVAATAAGGIAATFNAPVGGLAFAVELLMVSVNARTIAVVAAACAVAAYVAGFYAGVGPALAIPELTSLNGHWVGASALLVCLPFGVIAGAGSALLERGIYWVGDGAAALVKNEYLRHAAAMLLVGVMIQLFFVHAGQYYIAGVGYPAIGDMVAGVLTDPGLLFLLFAAKLLATALTLGTGASGGVFSPSLFLGAALGAAYGHTLALLAPGLGIEPVMFAMAGMAAVVGATSAAVVTAMVMVLEITQSYAAVLPIVITVTVAYLVRHALTAESVYTLKLVRRGRDTAHGLEHTMSVNLDAEKAMSTDVRVIERDRLPELFDEPRDQAPRYVVVMAEGVIAGVLGVNRDWRAIDPHDPSPALERRFTTLPAQTRWPQMMRTMHATGAEALIVVTPRQASAVEGVVTAREITRAVRDTTALAD